MARGNDRLASMEFSACNRLKQFILLPSLEYQWLGGNGQRVQVVEQEQLNHEIGVGLPTLLSSVAEFKGNGGYEL